jgi:phosphoribosylanthranilate isomerase
MEIKVCGLTSKDDILYLQNTLVNRLGFIFYDKSPRDVSKFNVSNLVSKLDSKIKKVGVFVNSDLNFIYDKIEEYKLDSVQLHGNESPYLCENLNKNIEVIKSFSINDASSFANCKEYLEVSDYFLFDTYTPSFGGSGLKFDWALLDLYDLKKPFLLSGGIDLDSIEVIRNLNHPYLIGIDVNSKFELFPGKKDIGKIELLIKKLKQ